MKKLVLFIGCLVLVGGLYAQSRKKLIDHPLCFEIKDSTATDTTYAPLIIPKEGLIIKTDAGSKDGSLALYYWDNTGKAMVTISAAELNDFANNDTLRTWLMDRAYPPKVLYGFMTLTGLDSIRINDTSEIYKIGVLVDGSSTDSLVCIGSVFTVDGHATDSTIFPASSSITMGDGLSAIHGLTLKARANCILRMIFQKRR